LSIIALILLLLCVFLFVPIRYRIRSNNESEIQASASVTWFLHLVHLHLIYKDDFSYCLTIFGIRIYPKRDKKIYKKKCAQKSTTQANSKSEKKIIKKIKGEFKEIPKEKPKAKVKSKSKEKDKESTKSKDKCKTKEKQQKKQMKIKEKIKFTFRNVCDKIKRAIILFKKNIYLIKDERTKRAFILCKKELFHLLKLIIPRKINGIVKIGMKDLSQTGEIYGLYSAFFPVHKGKVVMVPYFEEEIFSYKVMAIGRIRIITLLRITLKIYFNKDIQRLIHIFKKEED
jgi:hypothetical protein